MFGDFVRVGDFVVNKIHFFGGLGPREVTDGLDAKPAELEDLAPIFGLSLEFSFRIFLGYLLVSCLGDLQFFRVLSEFLEPVHQLLILVEGLFHFLEVERPRVIDQEYTLVLLEVFCGHHVYAFLVLIQDDLHVRRNVKVFKFEFLPQSPVQLLGQA